MARSAIAAVSRIAYLTSDQLVNLRPHSPQTSSFEDEWTTLSQIDSKRTTSSLAFDADPSPIVTKSTSSQLVTLTAHSHPSTISRLISTLNSLSQRALVLHIAVHSDLSDALLLKASAPFVLHSQTGQHAHDNALLAARLSQKSSKPVVHIFYASSHDSEISEIEEHSIQAFLSGRTHHVDGKHLNGVLHGNSNGYANGHTNGTASSGPSTPADTPTVEKPLALDDPNSLEALYQTYYAESLTTVALLKRAIKPFTRTGSSKAHTVIFTLGSLKFDNDLSDIAVVDVNVISPLTTSQILSNVFSSTREVIVLEQLQQWSLKWTPLYIDIATALQSIASDKRPRIRRGVIENSSSGSSLAAATLTAILEKQQSSAMVVVGTVSKAISEAPTPPAIPMHEASYTKMLSHVFGERFEVVNAPELVLTHGELATKPEFALGRIRAQDSERRSMLLLVEKLLQDDRIPRDLHSLLTQWHLSKDATIHAEGLLDKIKESLVANSRFSGISQLQTLQHYLSPRSRWIIGSDAWSYDLGSSGVHHAIVSGLNVNLLILDTLPYSTRSVQDPDKRKKDIGLYAMNYGNVYVASVAVYSSYGQVLQALVEADQYPGPSIVLAYLPYEFEDDSALSILKESKLAMDSGYWPLYRWDPSLEAVGRDALSLDSEVVKADLQEFINRQNHLSQLVRSKPEISSDVVGSVGKHLLHSRKRRAKEAYDRLLSAIDSPPIIVLYASDGGAAEKIAKRLGRRADTRGLSSRVQTMDSMPLDELSGVEEHIVFVTSTAGQGEPPQNGRNTFKALNAAVSRTATPLLNLKFAVFAMGDSHYWPRPEDAHYYNRPGKDLDHKLETLGGQRFADLGLGDDQDADGPETGYKAWEPLLWKALGVDGVEAPEAEPDPITNENIKIASNFLRGTIAEGLADETTGALAPSDGQLTKFHGIYEQDDRDIRDQRQEDGLEPAYAFMIRCRLPGGVCTPAQWLAMSQIADEHGNGTFKMTTRQTFQFHGVIKRHLKPAIQDINRALMDTIAACGDVNRNVLCASLPELSHLHEQAYQFAKELSEKLLPKTTAYHEIWLDKKQVAGDAVKDFEPMYGAYYLPRKFKMAVAIPPNNDVDVFANDVGFIAIAGKDGGLCGFNVTAGGGMGVTHSNKKTYPRTGDLLGFCTVAQGHEVAKQILLTQRDNGNRQDRKNARLKYTIDRMGLDTFKSEVEQRLGFKFEPPRAFTFDRNIDDFGWVVDANGKHNFTMFIENGRVADEPGRPFKSALEEIAQVHTGTFRLTANQHLVLAGITSEDLPMMKSLLAKHKLDNLDFSGLRLSSSACVAFPTCGLAMAESERYLPVLIDKVEKMCEENGLRHDSIVMRMTGCPNGCARPYVAEVAFVGKSPGAYLMLLGGGYYGQRLNKIYRENVTEPEILEILGPMIRHYATKRLEGERFGDFVIRAGYIAPTTSGKEWYDKMGGEGEYKEVTG